MRRRLANIVIILLLSGCVSTESNAPKKWSPEERADAHVNLGMTYLRERQYATAAIEFDAAIATNPKSDRAHHAKGLLLAQQGDDLQATSHFEQAVILNPENYLAINDLGIHLCQHKQTSKGVRYLLKIEDHGGNDQMLGTQLGLGICYHQSGRIVKADRYLRTVLRRSPFLPQALLPMAEVSFSQKEYLSARGFLERYFSTGAISEQSLYLGAVVENQLGDVNKANQYRRELLRRYPGSRKNLKLKNLLSISS